MASPHLQPGVVQLHKKPYFLYFTPVSAPFALLCRQAHPFYGKLGSEKRKGAVFPSGKRRTLMKLQKPFRRAAAALLSGAMLLSLCAPALAAEPGVQLQKAESSTNSILFNDMTIDPERDDHFPFPTTGSTPGASVEYFAASHRLTVTGTVSDPLTISAPGVDVVLYSADGPAVKNNVTLSACASAAITSTKPDAQAITGTASITSSGDVTITGADRAVGGETLTVDAGGSVTVTGGCAGASIWHNATITAAESVTIGNANEEGWAQGTEGIGKLTINAGGNVTITGGTASRSTLNDADIRCGGEMELCNPTGGPVLSRPDSSLRYVNTGAKETVFRHAGDSTSVFVMEPDGSSINCGNRSSPSWFTAKYEESYPLTMTNCRVFSRDADHFYKDETVELLPVRPANATAFKNWTVTAADGSDVTFQTISNGSIRFRMPARGAFVTANYETAENLSEPAIQITAEGSTSCIITPSTLKETPVDGITYDSTSNTFTVSRMSETSQQFQGLALTSDALPNVTFQNAKFADLTVEGMRDVALKFSSVGDSQTGKILLTNVRNVQLDDTHMNYFEVDGAQDVTITASAPLCSLTELRCSGNVEITSTTADPAGFSSYCCMISTQGNVTLKGTPSSTLSISAANHVTVDAPVLPQFNRIHCSGIVDITQHSVPSADSKLYYRQTEGQSYIVTLNGVPSNALSGQLNITETEMQQLRTLLITPIAEPPAIDTDIDTGSASGDIGGAIAAVAIGGAAVWGGYEAATRIILHKLLPEGAAIPKTQAELAVLVWTAAGNPEPARAPAFADVDETTAKAAQWCTEQGLLDGSFAPAKRVTKYRVIRVWKQAFPTG